MPWFAAIRRKAAPAGAEFILVDPAKNTSEPAFDHARLAAGLSQTAKREYKSTELPFDRFDYSDDEKSIQFQVDGSDWSCKLESYVCKAEHDAEAGPYESLSPDKKWLAYIKDYNLCLRYLPTGENVQLTRDGEPDWSYATPIPGLRPMVAQGTQDIKQRPAVFWSQDSSRLVTYRMDTRTAGRSTRNAVPRRTGVRMGAGW